MYYGVI
jgi:predicted outer membrane repeat protein